MFVQGRGNKLYDLLKKTVRKDLGLKVTQVQGEASQTDRADEPHRNKVSACGRKKSEDSSSHTSKVEFRDHMLSVLCGINHSAD